MKTILISLLLLLQIQQQALAAGDSPASFTYQGKIFKANGRDPVEDPAVVFKVQVRTPDGLCVLFEETHFRDMTGKSGLFSLVIGEGANTNATSLTLSQVFDNNAVKSGAGGCNYTPVAGDTRRLRFSYDNGTETVTMSTDQTLRSVPYAMVANSLQGATKDQFIQVSAQTTQAKIDVLSGYYSQLVDLATGTSTSYAKSSDLPISGGILNLLTGGVKVPDAPASNDSAVNKNYSDSKVGGKTLDLAGLANGQTLMWNAALNKWQANTITQPNVGTSGTYTKVTTDAQGRVTAGSNLVSGDISSALGFSPINKAGDTLTGAMNFNGQNLLNSGYITMNPGKYLGLGSYDASSEANLVTNILTPGGASYAGVTWYNSVTKSVKYWDGSQAVILSSNVSGAIGSLNGLTAASQSFAMGTAGVSPAWVSSTSTHTLNIPAASTVGVTGGLLSNIDYVAFSNKQNALGYVPLDRAGTVAMSASLNMSADGGTTLNKIINLKNPTAVQDAATKSYADEYISGLPSNINTLNNSTDAGKVLSWSGTAWTVVTANPGTVTSVTVSAPLTISNATSTPAIALQAGTGSGQSLIWNGSAWAGAFANMSQLRGVASAYQFPTTCTAAQTLSYSVVTDTYSCANVAITSAQVSGLGAAASLNVGTAAGTLAAGDDSRIVNAIQSSTALSGDLSGTHGSATVTKIRGIAVSSTAPTLGQVLKYNSASSSWEASSDITNAGTVTSITPGTGFTTSTPVTSSGTLNVNVGTSANQIVQLDSSAKLPAVDGSQLTNMPVVPFTNVVVASGTSWAVPAGVKKVFVQVWGAGGGGAGGATLGTGGGGGGGGGYAASFVDVSSVSSVTIAVGSGGAGAASAGANGNAGGTSSFGSVSASGGAAGIAAAVTGANGGATLSGTITIAGGPGHVGNSAISVLTVVNLLGLGGAGGTAGGGGGIGGNGSLGTGTAGAGTAPGGGGGGGGSGYSSGSVGAAGGAGRILVWY